MIRFGGGEPKAARKRKLKRGKKKKRSAIPKDLYVALAFAEDSVVLVNWDGNLVWESSSLDEIRERLPQMIQHKVLVGHGLNQCFRLLRYSHPRLNLRDCATYAPYMEERRDPLSVMLLPRDLTELAADVLKRKAETLQEQAQAAMLLYQNARTDWEEDIARIVEQQYLQRQMFEEKQRMEWELRQQQYYYKKSEDLSTSPVSTAQEESSTAWTDHVYSIPQEEDTIESDYHLPQSLLEEDLDIPADSPPEREDSSHPVDSDDWLSLPRRITGFRRLAANESRRTEHPVPDLYKLRTLTESTDEDWLTEVLGDFSMS